MHVGVIAIPGTFGSSFTSVLDLVRTAEALRTTVDRGIPAFQATILGLRPSVRTGGGLIIEADRAFTDPIDDLDVLVVPTLGALNVAELEQALQLPEVRELAAALREIEVPTLAGACTGTFVLAEAGRLSGASATTCWWLAEAFQRRYPTVMLDHTRMVVRSGRTITAGAAFAHIDLAISLIAEVSGQLADTVARHMLVDERPARSSQAILGHLTAADDLVIRFEDEIRNRLDESLAVTELAASLNVTARTLERRVLRRTGLTPNQLIRRLRVERAQHLRRTTQLSMDQIARLVGYASAVTLRRAIAQTS